jgi:hypothetical protein
MPWLRIASSNPHSPTDLSRGEYLPFVWLHMSRSAEDIGNGDVKASSTLYLHGGSASTETCWLHTYEMSVTWASSTCLSSSDLRGSRSSSMWNLQLMVYKEIGLHKRSRLIQKASGSLQLDILISQRQARVSTTSPT